ncbi:MAG: AAA family ATPase [Lachnospiraceae bacterium]|jgi:hypothetical protein|nr:AAA family ATPase [Lachnospiraceae bacterium]
MNISQAKQEIMDTVRCYLKKDDLGGFEIPVERQRPILLIGPPGIGKTAIMEQAAQEMGINLISYTITHHTRQSAIGLPFISKRSYGGKEYSVTEYTMSEIIASVYDQIERSGIREGILFLDEINCVSETLAPTMLQFLQYKTFGTHKVPDGFLIVTAGNPPQYNQSVRDFDISTLDRVKRIDIEEDFEAWKEYGYRSGIHGAVMNYLAVRREHFYSIRTEADAKYFVTARGWEDFSRMIAVREELGMPVTKDLAVQYLQDPEIAGSFAVYYELWNKYKNCYRIPEILEGRFPADTQKLSEAPFDEKLSILGLLIDTLHGEFRDCAESEAVQKEVLAALKKQGAGRTETAGVAAGDTDAGKTAVTADAAATAATTATATPAVAAAVTAAGKECRERLERGISAHLLDRQGERMLRKSIAALSEAERLCMVDGADADGIKDWFAAREDRRAEAASKTDSHLSNAFRFLSRTFGDGQEIVIFLTELSKDYYSLQYVSEYGNDEYYKYNKLLLLKERGQELRNEVEQALRL